MAVQGQLEILNSYVEQVKDVEQMEKRVKTEKTAVDQKLKQVDERTTKLRADEDFHRKQKSEWDSQSTRRQSELEDALKEKRELIAKLEKDFATKSAELVKKQSDFEQFK